MKRKMVFYSDGNAYGVRWRKYEQYDDKGISSVAFELFSHNKLNRLQIQHIQKTYESMTEKERSKKASISFYVCCTSPENPESFMAWFPCNEDVLKDLFKNKNLSNYRDNITSQAIIRVFGEQDIEP